MAEGNGIWGTAMRYAIPTAIAVALSAQLSYAQDAPPTRACGQYEEYRISYIGSEDLGDEAATAACGVPKAAADLIAGCSSVIDASDDVNVRSHARFNRALARVVLGDLDGAIDDLESLLPSDSDSDGYAMRGLAHFCRGDLESALADLNRALEIWDENDLAYTDRARVYFAQGDFDRAWDDALEASEIELENATALVLMGAIAEAEGDMIEAAYDYDEALEIEFFCDCGEIDYDAVDEAFERVFAAATEPALAACRSGDGETAIAGCTDYLEMDYFLSTEETAEAYALRGAAHLAADEIDNALADFEDAVGDNGELPQAFIGRGSVRMLTDDLDGAIDDFTEAFRLDPRNALALTQRARAFVDLGEWSRASADLTGTLFLDPDSADALSLRGLVRENQGRREDALDDFKAALAIDPTLTIAVEGLVRLAR